MGDNKRLLSLDVLRGFDMLFIMGMSEFIAVFCSLFPGGKNCWLARNMFHVEWNGLHFEDTIFPLFLFIAGISFPFSLRSQLDQNKSKIQISFRIIKRGIVLIIFGIIYNGFFQFDFENLRIASVLGRIGIAWMIAALLYLWCKRSIQVVIGVVILIGYWLIMRYLPGSDDPFSYMDNLVGVIDRAYLPGKLHEGVFDPEGLFSSIPAIVTAMMGIFTGDFIKNGKNNSIQKVNILFFTAAVFLVIGLVWNSVFPINKKLWTSSFVMVVGAYSIAIFAVFYYIIDIRGIRTWTFPFKIIGLNSITIYMAQIIISFWDISKFFLGGIANLIGGPYRSVVLYGGYVAACWLFLYYLYKKKTFLKI